MTTNSSASKTINLAEERKDVRFCATDEETFNEETALKIECSLVHYIGSRLKLPEEFLNKRHLHFQIDRYNDELIEFLGTYSVLLLKTGDKEYVGKESFDISNKDLLNLRSSSLFSFTNWAENNKLDVKIKKIKIPAYKSPSMYFPEKQHSIHIILSNRRKVQLTKDERFLAEHLFYMRCFEPKGFFRKFHNK